MISIKLVASSLRNNITWC